MVMNASCENFDHEYQPGKVCFLDGSFRYINVCSAWKANLPFVRYNAWDIGICVRTNVQVELVEETADFAWSYYHDCWTCFDGDLAARESESLTK